jgi:sulfur-oxidizing protein SoxB
MFFGFIDGSNAFKHEFTKSLYVIGSNSMPTMNKRTFLKLAAMGVAGTAAGSLPLFMQQAHASEKMPKDFYSLPKKGQARILHTTDLHGQLLPVYFREPNVNLGVGVANGRPPHIVGKKLLEKMQLPLEGPEAYAYTYLDFLTAAKKYGKTGGYAHIKTLLDRLRKDAGGVDNTLTIDGGDLWQGSGTSLWTRGVDMVEASNILGVDVMVGHWEFTYAEQEVLSNVALFKGDFIGQNVRVKDDSLMDDKYTEMVEKNNGLGLFDEDSGNAFQPYVMKKIGGKRIAVVGQAFPRTANANPPEFFPDWSFGLREDDMAALVKKIRTEEKPDAVIMLSHNGKDVDIKMGENVPGIDAVFGGHTHDGIPRPIEVKNKDGGRCLVTNAGSNGKFVGVMDIEVKDGGKVEMHYKMLPVITNWLPADKEMDAYITQMRSKKYDDKIIEARNKKFHFNKARVGKSYDEILTEKLAIADRTLYRRGNFMGTWDQVLCNSLREEYKADIALSAGVRWGTSTLKGDWITMEDVMTQCSMTYAETYVMDMKGKALLEMLEQVADNLFDPDPYLQSGGDMVRVGGLDYTIEPAKKLYSRITEARLDNGDKIEADKTYKIAGWATVNRTPDGRLLWDITRDYILKNKGKDDVLTLKKINRPKLLGVSDNVGLADYEGETG